MLQPREALPVTRLSLEAFTDALRDEILGIWRENLLIQEPGRFEWFYRENPYGPAHTWGVRDPRDGRLIGLASLYPRMIQVNGQPARIASAIDISVVKGHRVFGPAVDLARHVAGCSREAGYTMVLAAPNRPALGVFRLARYHLLGEQKNWVKPVKARHLVKRIVRNRLAAAIAGGLLDWWLDWADRFRLLRFELSGMSVRETRECDGRFDLLWQEARSASPISVIKDQAYLQWRYVRCRTMEHTFFCLHDDRGQLRAFLVYTLLENNVAVVTDMVAATPALRAPLLLKFARHLRSRNASHISMGYFGERNFARLLKRIGFVPRNTVRHCLVHLDDQVPEAVGERVLQPDQWSLFEGDLDL